MKLAALRSESTIRRSLFSNRSTSHRVSGDAYQHTQCSERQKYGSLVQYPKYRGITGAYEVLEVIHGAAGSDGDRHQSKNSGDEQHEPRTIVEQRPEISS